MTSEERLNNKFKEVLERRNELEDRMRLQEDVMLAAERVMDVFGYGFVDGTKIQEIKMNNLSGNMITFGVKVADGRFYSNHKCFSEELREALRLAKYSADPDIKDWVLEILDEYFEISEDSGTIIRI